MNNHPSKVCIGHYSSIKLFQTIFWQTHAERISYLARQLTHRWSNTTPAIRSRSCRGWLPKSSECRVEPKEKSYPNKQHFPWRIQGCLAYLPIHEWLILKENLGKYVLSMDPIGLWNGQQETHEHLRLGFYTKNSKWNDAAVSPFVSYWKEPSLFRGHYISDPSNALLRGNPSNLPYICSVWYPFFLCTVGARNQEHPSPCCDFARTT